MSNLVQSDVFFFISTIAIIVCTVAIGIITFHVIRILKDIKHISENVVKESDRIVSDIEFLREKARVEADHIKTKISSFFNLFRRKKSEVGIKKPTRKNKSSTHSTSL